MLAKWPTLATSACLNRRSIHCKTKSASAGGEGIIVQRHTGGRTLFILAGMPGSGKSRLLHLGLSKRLPIFGEVDQPAFETMRLPEVYPEDQISVAQRLRTGTWISETHLCQLPASAMPPTVVVHLDLFCFLLLLHFATNRLPALADLDCLSAAALSDGARVTTAYRALLSQPFFQHWDRIAVNTLCPPYSRTAAQWHDREAVVQRPERTRQSVPMQFLRDEIYGSPGGQRVYTGLYTAWQNALSLLTPAVCLLTSVDEDNAFQIRRVQGMHPR